MELKVGDLVMVVKPMSCCGRSRALGHIFRVAGFGPIRGFSGYGRCAYCGTRAPVHASAVQHPDGKATFDRNRLIKIDPPAEMKDTETEKELTV